MRTTRTVPGGLAAPGAVREVETRRRGQIVSLIEDDGWCLVAQPDFAKHYTSDMADADILRGAQASGIVMGMDEEQGIYRDEVRLMMGALADIYVDTGRILAVLGYEEDGDEEEEVDS